ncbi:uncharacterized protein LOC109606739 [Aethina tumida]|uniref:uncharacterized protein LOC109606739 n=1 Tax=Aethina tumida TaxID=116153 RepID=UPI00096B0F4D|nr:uncharacterized protein LOC109606739 [Aethina tumida]
MASVKYCLLLALLVGTTFIYGRAEDDSKESSSSEESLENSTETNSTGPQDLYVIKTVVYEVGILTDASNDTGIPSNETHEQVDLSFFDPKHNGSVIDLSKIPLPIQTNISGVSVTGILPSNLGAIILPNNGSDPELNASFPILPNKQVKVTQNISTDNPQKGSAIVSNLPQILGLTTNNETKEA